MCWFTVHQFHLLLLHSLWCLLPTQVSGLETHMHYSDPGQSGSHTHNTLRLSAEVRTSSPYSGQTVWTRYLGISTALV